MCLKGRGGSSPLDRTNLKKNKIEIPSELLDLLKISRSSNRPEASQVRIGLACAFSVTVHAASANAHVLELNDLCPGYVQTVSKPLEATKPGQIGGYETDFKRTTFSGVADIEDQVYTCRSVTYAHAGYLRSIAALKASRPFKHHNWQPMSSGDIGNVREAFIEGQAWKMDRGIDLAPFRTAMYSFPLDSPPAHIQRGSRIHRRDLSEQPVVTAPTRRAGPRFP